MNPQRESCLRALLYPTLPIPNSCFNFCFFIKHWDPKSYGVRCLQPSYSQDTDLAQRNCRGLLLFHQPSPHYLKSYPPTPAVNSSTLTTGFLFVGFCTQIFEKNDVLKKNACSRKMRKVVFNPPKMQPYPFFSKIILFTLFGEKLFCDFHREISGENDCSRENDCLSWERSLIEMCKRTMPCHFTGGSLIIVFYFGPNMSSTMARENDEWLNMHFPRWECVITA